MTPDRADFKYRCLSIPSDYKRCITMIRWSSSRKCDDAFRVYAF